MQNGLFGRVICPHLSNSQPQAEVFTAVVLQAGQGLRGGTCLAPVCWHSPRGSQAPALAPAAHEKQMGSALLAPHSCSSAAAADLISCLGFTPSASLVGGSKEFPCTWVLIPTCPCVFSFGIREQQRLLCPSGRGYHQVSQKGKGRLMSAWSSSISSQCWDPQSRFQWQSVPNLALKCPWGSMCFLNFLSCGMEVSWMQTKGTINRSYQKLYEINKMSYAFPPWAMPEFACQGCWPDAGWW